MWNYSCISPIHEGKQFVSHGIDEDLARVGRRVHF
jgi:hypothetical protein